MAYTDQTKVEAQLGRSLTASEEIYLDDLIASVDATLDDTMGGSYGAPSASSRFYDGGWQTMTIDPAYDITAVEVVDSDTSNTVIDTFVIGEDVELYPLNDTVKTHITRRNVRFPRGLGKIKVTGKFSLGATVPGEISYLSTYLVAKTVLNIDRAGITSEQIEGYSRQYMMFDITTEDEFKRIMAQYEADDILL